MKEISFRNDVLPLKDKFYRLALRITRNREEAEDIVQETLIRLWDKRNELHEGMESLGFTICRNLALDQMQKKEAQNVAFDPELHETADNGTSPAEMLIAKEGRSIIQEIPVIAPFFAVEGSRLCGTWLIVILCLHAIIYPSGETIFE